MALSLPSVASKSHSAKYISGWLVVFLMRGDVARVLHRFADAERSYREALSIALELDTPAERCAVLRRQGLLNHAQKRYREALDCWVQALAGLKLIFSGKNGNLSYWLN